MIQPGQLRTRMTPATMWSARGRTSIGNNAKGDLGQAFLAAARQWATSPAFINDVQSTPYSDVAAGCEQFSQRLVQSRHWRPGSRVAISLRNSPSYAVAFYGTLLAGGVVVPLSVEQTTAWKDAVIEATGCLFVTTENPNGALIPDCNPTGCRLKDELPTTAERLAAIFFTSGSSGGPKGVMLSHENFLANADSICQSLPLRSGDRALAVLPFCHAFGNSILQTHLLNGGTLVTAGSPAFPESLITAMQRHEVASFYGVPDLFRWLLQMSNLSRQTLPSLRYAAVAGGALRVDLTLDVAKRLDRAELFVMYGQTEATARLSCLPAKELIVRQGSIGRGLPNVTVQVVDPDGQPVRPGQLGEIRARGPNIMQGYWNDPAATQQILRDGWLYTGDIATVDDEGYVYPKGRLSQLVKIGGYRVHPAEIETVVAREFPTLEPLVVPYEAADGVTRLALFLTPLRPGATANLTAVRRCCLNKLARFQRPHQIQFLQRPPLTPSLKPDRQRLSALAAEGDR